MSHHQSRLSPQFFVTAPQPCPYLEGKEERKLFTGLRGNEAEPLNDMLSLRGFRRSQAVAYRPACASCNACMSCRIPVDRFTPNRAQRKIWKRNDDIRVHVAEPQATEQQFQLFQKYLENRHADGGMADMDSYDFAAMIEETPITTHVLEYTLFDSETGQEKLIAACLTDVLEDGLSMVYSFYDPDYEKRSLGTYMILQQIELAHDVGLPHLYLGYWVPGSPKMAYKAKFAPLEIFKNDEWQEK